MIAEHDSHDGLTAISFTLAQAGGSSTPELFGGTPSAPPTGGTQGVPLTTPPAGGGGGGPGQSMLLIFALPLLFIVLLSMWTSKKERRKRETLLSSVKKHDRVLTVAGIIGTVTEIRDDAIVLRVDDNTKTKLEFAKSAITQVIRASDAPATAQDAQIETKAKGEKAAT